MTQEDIKKACNAMFTGGTFEMITSRGFDLSVQSYRIYIDSTAIARVDRSRLFVSVVNNRNKTAIDLLNALPNVNIERDNGIYKLNVAVWDGGWFKVVDDLYKHEDDL